MSRGGETELEQRPRVEIARVIVSYEHDGARRQVQSESDDPISVGAAADNAVVLGDPKVSRYHIDLQRTPDGILVRDLRSRNGTWIGAVRVSEAVVPPSTEIRVGETLLRLDDGANVAVGPPETSVEGVVARSLAMRSVTELVAKAARSEANVLVQGETGTGKEVIARAIHGASARSERPFEVVDCGSLPPTLIASELFGHERGAFTGADKRHVGAFERAQGGVIFLDEIGELPAVVQPSLLGVLERRRFRRVGGEKELEVDVRVVSATHRDLRAAVNEGRFRADLYYRLAVVRITLPALRERPEDIEPLVRHFIREATGAEDEVFSEEALEALRKHPWSGNVRELRNVVEASLTLGRLSLDETRRGAAPAVVSGNDGAFLGMVDETTVVKYRDARQAALDAFEAAYLATLSRICDGNASKAARLAHMDRMHLVGLLKKRGLR